MLSKEIPNRIESEDWRECLEKMLGRRDDLITESKRRMLGHGDVAVRIARSKPEQFAASRDLHNNSEAGLRFLIAQRNMLIRELDYLHYKKALAA